MSAMKQIAEQLEIWGINPETATDEELEAAYGVVFILKYDNGGWA